MSSNVVRVNRVEVTSDGSKPTMININLNQPAPPSCFQDMLNHLGTSMKPLGDGEHSSPRTNVPSSVSIFAQAKHGLEVARIMIGLASISLGVLLCLVQASMTFEKGTGFWTGFLFLLSGILSMVREETPSLLWLWASRLMNLASFAVAIAGIVVIACDFNRWSWNNSYVWSTYHLCEPQRGRATPPAYHDYYREQHCKDVTGGLLGLFKGVRVLLLQVVISGLITTLCSVGCDLWARYCTSKEEEEEDSVDSLVEPLLPSLLPPAYQERQNKCRVS
ncbi:transmembrane protein 176B-like isoform X2 [Ambystoma mexicanum]